MADQQPILKISSRVIGGEAAGIEAITALVFIVFLVCATWLVRSVWGSRKI